MRHRPTSTMLAIPLVVVSTLLAGCAEMHRGVEAVGRIGPSAAPAGEADAAPASRTDVRTVRPRGAPRAPASDEGAVAPPSVTASAVPSPHQIFDFHPAGSRPDAWRQPFVIDASDGPLAADVRRSSAELKAFLADHKGEATRTAGRDGSKAAPGRRTCGEMDVAAAKPGCGVPRPQEATPKPGIAAEQ